MQTLSIPVSMSSGLYRRVCKHIGEHLNFKVVHVTTLGNKRSITVRERGQVSFIISFGLHLWRVWVYTQEKIIQSLPSLVSYPPFSCLHAHLLLFWIRQCSRQQMWIHAEVPWIGRWSYRWSGRTRGERLLILMIWVSSVCTSTTCFQATISSFDTGPVGDIIRGWQTRSS